MPKFETKVIRIRIRIFGLIWIRMSVENPFQNCGYIRRRHSFRQVWLKWAVDCMRTEKTEKCWQMLENRLFLSGEKNWKTGIHAHIRITTKSQPLLEGHLLPVPAKFGRRPFPRSSVILFTEWQNDWKNDRERSNNIRLIDGGNNNNNMLYG